MSDTTDVGVDLFDKEIDRLLAENPAVLQKLREWAQRNDDGGGADENFIPFAENHRRLHLGHFDDQINAMLADAELRASLDSQHEQLKAGTLMMESWGVDFSGPPRGWIFEEAERLLATDGRLGACVERQVLVTPWTLKVEPPGDEMRARLLLAVGLRRAGRRHVPIPE